jgi:hypothetical protein
MPNGCAIKPLPNLTCYNFVIFYVHYIPKGFLSPFLATCIGLGFEEEDRPFSCITGTCYRERNCNHAFSFQVPVDYYKIEFTGNTFKRALKRTAT